MIKARRIYETPIEEDTFRIFVERLWPRGMTKARARVDLWLKDIAPSPELHRWYHHDPERWPEFKKRYRAELRKRPGLFDQLRSLEKEKGNIELVYATKSEERNNTVLILEILNKNKSRK